MTFARWMAGATLAGMVMAGGIIHSLEHEQLYIHTAVTATLYGVDHRDSDAGSGSLPISSLTEDDLHGPANGGGGVGGGSRPSA